MNHSCAPNCALQKWVVGASVRVGMFTLKDIPVGTELTFDYKFERYGMKAQPCYCDESICSGFIGGNNKTSNADFTFDENLDGGSDISEDEEMPSMLDDGGLESPEQIPLLVKALLYHPGNATKVLKVVNKVLVLLLM